MALDEAGSVSKAAFADAFSTLRPIILQEWTAVDEQTLAATGGELEKVIALVAERTTHTKALIRRQLDEIYQVVIEKRSGIAGTRFAASRNCDSAEPSGNREPMRDFLLEDLERRVTQILRELRGGFLDGAKESVRNHTIFSLLVAIGLGFIVGTIFTSLSRSK